VSSDPANVLHNVNTPTPKPLSTQVLLKVHTVALNPAGFKAIQRFPSFIVKKPSIPEFDVAGTVVSVGPDVRRWKIGDELFGIINPREVLKTGQGGLAEYTLAREEHLYAIILLFLISGTRNLHFYLGRKQVLFRLQR